MGVPTYGDITLDEDEEAVLSLPPKFAMFRKFTLEDIKIRQEVADIKARWDRRNRDWSPEGKEVTPEEDMEPKTRDELVAENSHREVYNNSTKVFDCRGLPPCDIKSNPRVQLPAPRTAAEELN